MTEHNQKDHFEENPQAANLGSTAGTGTTTMKWDDENAVYSEGQGGQDSMRRQAGEAVGTATSKVKEAVRETTDAVTEQAKQRLGQATDTTKQELTNVTEQVRQQADQMISEQKGMAAERLHTLADTLRQTSRQLQNQDEPTVSHYAEVVADQIDAASDFLRNRNAGDMLGEVQRWARRSPEVFVAGSLAVGFLIGRFIKGPSRSAERVQGGYQGYQGQGYQGQGYQGQGYQGQGYQGSTYGQGMYQGQGQGMGQGMGQGLYRGSDNPAEGVLGSGIQSTYEGGSNAYQTGPDMTEGSDTDYPRYDPSYAGGGSLPEANTEAIDESTSEGSGYTPTSRR